MLESAADAQLSDFGLARTAEGTATATSVMGTPGYAAPESYRGLRSDPRSDLYGFGAVLFFAATGQSPFGVGNPAGILQAQLSGSHAAVRELRPDLPSDLAETIDRLLAVDPERRPPSAREVGEAVAAAEPALVPVVPDTWDPTQNPMVDHPGVDKPPRVED